MRQEEIVDFNRKIAESNPTQLICVLYEIYFAYQRDAIEALEADNQEEYIKAVRGCSRVVQHLRSVLDFTYEISGELYALYTFVARELAKAMYRKKKQEILDAGKIMKSLEEAFIQVAKEDSREPMMNNTQKVTVGLTYGRHQLNESVAKDIGTRGFWA